MWEERAGAGAGARVEGGSDVMLALVFASVVTVRQVKVIRMRCWRR